MDERMLLLSLHSHGQSRSAAQIVAQWEPTWTESEVVSMLCRLEAAGDVVREDDGVTRYRSASSVAV